jgi:hypothetical protein
VCSIDKRSLSCIIIKSLPNLALIAGKICFSSNISYPKLVKDLVKNLKRQNIDSIVILKLPTLTNIGPSRLTPLII